MAIKFGMTIAEMVRQLTRGFKSFAGREPDGLERIKIQQEAVQRFKDMNKVVDMEGKAIDTSKGIMGGRQIQDSPEFGEKVRRIYDEAKGPGKGQEMVDALKSPGARKSYEIMEDQLGVRLYGDETFDEILEIQRTGIHPRGEPPMTDLDRGIKQAYDKAVKEGKFKGTEDEFREKIDMMRDDIDDSFAEGGRIGLKDGMDRRTFMKIMGGIATLPLVGKFVKPAMPLIKKGAELTGPALDRIVQTVMSAGKLISQSGRRLKELTTKKKLKDVEVEEDMMDGPSYTIKTKDKTIYYRPGRQDEMGIEDDVIEVIEDTVTKKAGGGIARMLGE